MHAISVITEETGLAELWPAWQALWERVSDAWPFTAPAWSQPWWEAFGTGCPVVAAMHSRYGLSGLLPFYRLGEKLLPMGVGISDYFDILLAPDAPPDAAALLLEAALQASNIPRCDMPELPEHAVLLRTKAPPGWRDDVWDGSPCAVLPLYPEPAIPKGMRRDLRQARRRAERAGGWQVARADTTTWPELLDSLIVLHTKRWQASGEPGVFADTRVPAFHRAAVPLLLQAGLLRMEALRLRDRIVAVNYALLTSGRIGFYLAGFDIEAAFESPGTILLGHMLEEAAREGRKEAHLLRGDEAYKRAWGAVERRNAGRSFIRT